MLPGESPGPSQKKRGHGGQLAGSGCHHVKPGRTLGSPGASWDRDSEMWGVGGRGRSRPAASRGEADSPTHLKRLHPCC